MVAFAVGHEVLEEVAEAVGLAVPHPLAHFEVADVHEYATVLVALKEPGQFFELVDPVGPTRYQHVVVRAVLEGRDDVRLVLLSVSGLCGSDVVASLQEVEALPESNLSYSVVGEEVDPFVQVDKTGLGGAGELWWLFAEAVHCVAQFQDHDVNDGVQLYNVFECEGRGEKLALACVNSAVTCVGDTVLILAAEVLARESLIELILHHTCLEVINVVDSPGVSEGQVVRLDTDDFAKLLVGLMDVY